jgi:hypothetical protein
MARSSRRPFAPGGNLASDSRKARIPFVTAAGFQGISACAKCVSYAEIP